jgi:hypothetical protein
MAGTVSISYSDSSQSIRSVTWSWTSDASGNVSGTDTKAIAGQALKWVTNPGSVAPTDNYDIVVNDADGLDVASGLLANRDTANSEVVYPAADTYHCFDGPLSLSISAAGNATTGTLTMYYRA